MISDAKIEDPKKLQQGLQQIVQKMDDSTIPTHLWDFAFLADQKADPVITTPLVKNWEDGLQQFRQTFLLEWRRKLIRSWV